MGHLCWWLTYKKKNGGAKILLITLDGEELSSSLRLEFKTTNNEAEYEVVIAGLGMALELWANFVEVWSDSQVIVGHVWGKFKAKGEKMKMYLSKVHNMQSSFQKFCIMKIPREDNEKANRLARMASIESLKMEPIQILTYPSISDQVLKLSTVEKVSDWRRNRIDYLENGTLSSEKKSVVQLRMKVRRFTILNGTLYKRGFTLPFIKCVSVEEGDYILWKIHEGICGSH